MLGAVFEEGRAALVRAPARLVLRLVEVGAVAAQLGAEAAQELERGLIAAGAIRPLGFRWVGIRR